MQTRLVEPRSISTSPSYELWSFPTPFGADDSLSVTSVRQLSLPLAASFTPVRDWRIDVSTAYTQGSLDASGEGGTTRSLSLDGLTDTKIRAVGRLLGERLWLTLGLNLPTGHDGLTDEEAAAVRIIGAPALRMTTPVLGSGTGIIVGPVYTAVLGRWAVGLGASFEMRGSYSPLEANLSGGGGTVADLDPAEAVHVSLGFDRIVGQGRMSFLFAGDRYGTDLVTLQQAEGQSEATTSYRLGPTFGAFWQYRVATPGARELRLWTNGRYRSEFSGAAGRKVEGSSGTTVDVGVSAIVGRAGTLGLVLGLVG